MKRINITLTTVLIFAIWFFGCQSPKDQKSNSADKLPTSLVLVDSLVVNELEPMSLQDISPSMERFLFYKTRSREIVVVDADGQVLHSFNRSVEGPESYGKFKLSAVIFLDEERIAVVANKGVHIYSIQGELLRVIKPDYDPANRFSVPDVHNLQMINDSLLLVYFPGRYESLGKGIEHQHNSKQLELLNLKDERFRSIISFPEQSKFQTDNTYSDIAKFPVASINEQHLWLCFYGESTVYQYDLTNPDAPLSSIKIEIPGFIEVPAVNDEKQDMRSMIQNMFSGQLANFWPLNDSDALLLHYRLGISKDELEAIHAQHQGNMMVMMDTLAARVVNRIGVWHQNQLTELEVSSNVQLNFPRLQAADGSFWFSANTEHAERDYNVFYKMRLE